MKGEMAEFVMPDGRRCCFASSQRVAHMERRWGYYTCYYLRTPEGGGFRMPAARFNKQATPTGRSVYCDAFGHWIVGTREPWDERARAAIAKAEGGEK